jgi:hypothetical protein
MTVSDYPVYLPGVEVGVIYSAPRLYLHYFYCTFLPSLL